MNKWIYSFETSNNFCLFLYVCASLWQSKRLKRKLETFFPFFFQFLLFFIIRLKRSYNKYSNKTDDCDQMHKHKCMPSIWRTHYRKWKTMKHHRNHRKTNFFLLFFIKCLLADYTKYRHNSFFLLSFSLCICYKQNEKKDCKNLKNKHIKRRKDRKKNRFNHLNIFSWKVGYFETIFFFCCLVFLSVF